MQFTFRRFRPENFTKASHPPGPESIAMGNSILFTFSVHAIEIEGTVIFAFVLNQKGAIP